MAFMTRLLASCGLLFSAAAAADAHHSIAGVYDERAEVTVEGVVSEFQFVSPHPFVLVDVTRGGTAERWRLDMDDRNEMREIGMSADTLKSGDRLLVTGSLARREPRRLYIRRLDRPVDGFSYEQIRSRPRLRRL